MTVIRPRSMSGRHGDRPGPHARDLDLAVAAFDRLESSGCGSREHERHEERDRSNEATHGSQSSRHFAGLS